MTKEDDYELDVTMTKYWWREKHDLYNVCFNGWSDEMIKRHPKLIKAYKEYKNALFNIEKEIKKL